MVKNMKQFNAKTTKIIFIVATILISSLGFYAIYISNKEEVRNEDTINKIDNNKQENNNSVDEGKKESTSEENHESYYDGDDIPTPVLSEEQKKIDQFLQTYLLINNQNFDVEKTSKNVFVKVVNMMFYDKNYIKEGETYFFSNSVINEYAERYFGVKNLNYSTSDDQFTYDENKKGFTSMLGFGLGIKEGPTYEYILLSTSTVTDHIIATYSLRYSEEEYQHNNAIYDVTLVLKDNQYNVVFVSKK